ncbi:MAG TPA: hypothetical protein VK154_06715 [Chitinophagales bacterium]|nr:hypothetical protein [Chitinophagales bacterium]
MFLATYTKAIISAFARKILFTDFPVTCFLAVVAYNSGIAL